MRNLNNFPDELFELSGKRLMALAAGTIVFSGVIGWSAGLLLVHLDIIAVQAAVDAKSQFAQPDAAAANAMDVAKEWQYPGTNITGTGTADSYHSVVLTPKAYAIVWGYYADKAGFIKKNNGDRPELLS